MGVLAAIISGLIAGVLIGALTEYYTSDSYKPTQNLAASSETGSATVIISGLSLGMLSTVAPVIIVGISVLVSYFCAGGASDFNLGLYGVGGLGCRYAVHTGNHTGHRRIRPNCR